MNADTGEFSNGAIQDAYPQNTPNAVDNSQPQANRPAPTVPGQIGQSFPDMYGAKRRLGDYDYFMRLFMGEHFEAFNMRIGDERYTREYGKLRYVMINFAGLVSKVVADMLFSEQPSFSDPDGNKDNQKFLDALVHENSLHIQNYESALSNSALGDALYKIRIGERFPGDKKPTVIIEDITPSVYFPSVNGFNVRQEPAEKVLAWTFWKGKSKYLRKEIHTIGQIENQIWSMENDRVLTQQSLSLLGPDFPQFEDTKIDRSLVIHVPNWKTGNRYFGISDYQDLDKLFYAINNRMTKTDNILDKHSDPILAVPPGVLDEKGEVKKKALGVIEVGDEANGGKPEYIVWNASLENAFKQIEKLVEFLFMVGEISPDVLGMGQGQSDSGRALKLKILRTIAKVARKKLYYDRALKEVLYVAMLVAKEHNIKVADLSAPSKPFYPDIEWQDGLPADMAEQVDIEAKRTDAGNTTVVDSIMRLDGVDEETAKKKAAEIKEANKIELPVSNIGGGKFGPNAAVDNGGTGNGKNGTSPTDDGKGGSNNNGK